MKKLAAIAVLALLLTGCEDPKQKAFDECVEKQTAYVASHYSKKQIMEHQGDLEYAIYEKCSK